MKEILEQLWRDFCFEQNIEDGPICMADVADFFENGCRIFREEVTT